MQTVFGFFFGYMVVAHILLPLYYKLNLTSIYGYLGTRIGTRAYRTGSFFFLLSRMLGTAAKLYLVCLILHLYNLKLLSFAAALLVNRIYLRLILHFHQLLREHIPYLLRQFAVS